jgi:hypothetical protein
VIRKLLIIVPTRNRAALAINAINSALKSDARNVEIRISDNSTIASEVDQLSDFVAERRDARISWRRPVEPMPMTSHWDWALRSALQEADISHVAVLTDRMMFKTGCLNALLAIVARYSDQIVSYDHDRVVDHHVPISVDLNPWSDEVLALSAKRLLALSAASIFPSALPRLLNCVVPRSILVEMLERYGSVVESISPDYSFCYRALALVEHIRYWDRAPIFHYALGQSNGESAARGVTTATSMDFMSTIQGTLFRCAPCPGIRTLTNGMIHEYCLVQGTTGSAKFPPVDISTYTAMLRQEIAAMENRDAGSEMAKHLSAWYEEVGTLLAAQQAKARRGNVLRRFARSIGVGALLLRVRQKLLPPVVRPRNPLIKPEFASLTSALEYASSSNGERISADRLSIYRL